MIVVISHFIGGVAAGIAKSNKLALSRKFQSEGQGIRSGMLKLEEGRVSREDQVFARLKHRAGRNGAADLFIGPGPASHLHGG